MATSSNLSYVNNSIPVAQWLDSSALGIAQCTASRTCSRHGCSQISLGFVVSVVVVVIVIGVILLCYYLRRRRRLCFWFGLFVCLSVCLSVCPSDYSQTCERIL